MNAFYTKKQSIICFDWCGMLCNSIGTSCTHKEKSCLLVQALEWSLIVHSFKNMHCFSLPCIRLSGINCDNGRHSHILSLSDISPIPYSIACINGDME